MSKAVAIIIIIALVAVVGIIFMGGGASAQKVEIKDGVQYITIDAKGGYFPKTTNAQAGVPLQGVCGMGMYSFVVNFS